MLSNFGANFKQARESLGLPLDKIAAETRISTRFLIAIENEEFQLLPGGIFNRGFIRAYAERVGLNPDEAVGLYEKLVSNNEEPLEVLRTAERASEKKSDRSLYPIAVGVLVVLIGVFYLLNRNANEAPTALEQKDPAVSQSVDPTPAPAPEPVEFSDPPVETPAPATAAAPTPAPPPETLILELSASNKTWVEVATDGKVSEAVLQPGETRSFSAQQTIDITIGNAGGLSMKVNGRDVGWLGKDGQVRVFKITPKNAALLKG